MFNLVNYDIIDIQVLDPDHDPRVILDNQRRERIPASERCDRCGGTGNEHLFTYRECEDCGGSGSPKRDGKPMFELFVFTMFLYQCRRRLKVNPRLVG